MDNRPTLLDGLRLGKELATILAKGNFRHSRQHCSQIVLIFVDDWPKFKVKQFTIIQYINWFQRFLLQKQHYIKMHKVNYTRTNAND